MDAQQAQEIANSPVMANVTYNSRVYIDIINGSSLIRDAVIANCLKNKIAYFPVLI
jgi:hypothetical protein